MGIFDKAKEALSEHTDSVDERTGQGYAEQVESGSDAAPEPIGDYLAPGQSAADAVQPPPAPVTRTEQ